MDKKNIKPMKQPSLLKMAVKFSALIHPQNGLSSNKRVTNNINNYYFMFNL